MPFEQTQRQTEIARHLPTSLYVLLVQASAYGQACGERLCVFTYICERDCVPDIFLNCHIIHFDEDMRFLCVLCLCVFQIRA